MGGKTKNLQRTKNNVKPSSSARSAELLGSTPTFVGFSAYTDGLKALAPGFSTTASDAAPETFDTNISPEFQLVLRKLAKKDAMTKKKALQEFNVLVEQTDLDALKVILPLWPKLYSNLANDIDYTVRELSQTALKLLAAKCKRALAPYLKQLMPVWIISRFDNYAPAASIAINSFRETFSSSSADRTQEVCLHCQSEICEYAVRNATFHSAATLSQGKGLTDEEAEKKYQRIVTCSLQALSFLLEQMPRCGATTSEDADKLRAYFEGLCKNQKFWNFSKHKQPTIRAAWFQLMYELLQQAHIHDVLVSRKNELIAVCFQNIDDSEPLVAPHIWGCVLLLQSTYSDWHSSINTRKLLLPKLSQLLRNGFNHNAQAICPNILPFFANLTCDTLPGVDMQEFHQQFFDDLKATLQFNDGRNAPGSKADYAIMVKTYFECLRYECQQLNNNTATEQQHELAVRLLHENVLALITWCLRSDYAGVKIILANAAALLAYWAQRQQPGSLYAQLLDAYWVRFFEAITAHFRDAAGLPASQLEHLCDFLHSLQKANPSFECQSVKFTLGTAADAARQPASSSVDVDGKCTALAVAGYVQAELKQLVIQLVRLCLDLDASSVGAGERQEQSASYIRYVQQLVDMYADDADFYERIGGDGGTLQSTLDLFVRLIVTLECVPDCETLLDIIFRVLSKLASTEQQFDYINRKLMQLAERNVQVWVLQRLLSYPLCVEPQVRDVLATPVCAELIRQLARDVVSGECKQHIQILHKCFFQTHQDEILIGPQTVADILDILGACLSAAELSAVSDTCGSFIAQILPVICSKQNASDETRRAVFLRLFQFSLRLVGDEDLLSEDTLWEITTSWQDALSSGDIAVVPALLRDCAAAVEAECVRMQAQPANLQLANVLSETLAKFIVCSTENIEAAPQRADSVDAAMAVCFATPHLADALLLDLGEFCLLLEALRDKVSLGGIAELHRCNAAPQLSLKAIFMRALVNLSAICKLVCRMDGAQPDGGGGQAATGDDDDDDEEITEDYCDKQSGKLQEPWSALLCEHIVSCLRVASMAAALRNVNLELDADVGGVINELDGKAQAFMRDSSSIVAELKERLLAAARPGADIGACRTLTYLVHMEQYRQFEEENATILLVEELAEHFVVQHGATATYLHTLQYLLPRLEQHTFTAQSPVMKTANEALWLRAAVYRSLIWNNFAGSTGAASNRAIIGMTLQFITELAELQSSANNILLYNVALDRQTHADVANVVEYVQLLRAVLEHFPSELTIKNWDLIRIALSSWVLSIAKSIEQCTNAKAATFIVAVYKLFGALLRFIQSERQRSSTAMLSSVIEEWENLFARDVNLVLFKAFYAMCTSPLAAATPPTTAACVDSRFAVYSTMLEELTPALELLDYGSVYQFCEHSQKITLDNLCNFLLLNLSNPVHALRTSCAHALRQLTRFFVAHDVSVYESTSDTLQSQAAAAAQQQQQQQQHFLHRFEDYLARYELPMRAYNAEFSFKLTEIADLTPIERHAAFSYLLLWDCIIYACAHAPTPLRAIYTSWLNDNKYEEHFLHFLFRGMPTEILKNHDSKFLNSDCFHGLSWAQLTERHISLDKYVCHLYTQVLRKLPAVVRRWWNLSPSRQKTFVDKLTTNFVSLYICNEELRAITNKKEKHENMQVSVHTSTREVLAVYAIEDARMELVITLAKNHPLGGVKVDCGKQIGGRTASRNLGMQLTIFLTHQNGTIFDGLTLWKNNLDKKFEGVEECYVCYTVIHQDTCQLPKLCCKTCKKKFHGPCLYKWFTTSSKSTCPICRNVF